MSVLNDEPSSDVPVSVSPAADGGLALGALADPLRTQLDRMGAPYDPDTMDHFQRDMEAISRIGVRGLIPLSAKDNAYDRLAKRIIEHVHKTLAAGQSLSEASEDGSSPQNPEAPHA